MRFVSAFSYDKTPSILRLRQKKLSYDPANKYLCHSNTKTSALNSPAGKLFDIAEEFSLEGFTVLQKTMLTPFYFSTSFKGFTESYLQFVREKRQSVPLPTLVLESQNKIVKYIYNPVDSC